jgi:hypothetical protein
MSEKNPMEGIEMPEKSFEEIVDKINKGEGSNEDLIKVAELACREIAVKLKEKGFGVNKETVLYLSSININPAEINKVIPFVIEKLKEESFIEEVQEGRYKYIGENSQEDKQGSMIEHEVMMTKNIIDPLEEQPIQTEKIREDGEGYFKKLADRHRKDLEGREEAHKAREKLEEKED